jgi:hypothetical protein
MRLRLAIGLLSAFSACASPPPAPSPRDTLAALNALGLDSARVYSISQADRIELHAGDLIIALEGGKLAFYQPFEGHITGFVFSGIGHTLAIPHDPAEKQQMARFLGAPILDQTFVSIYARFTDDTAKELLAQFEQASLQAAPDDSFAALWQSNIERLNPSHALRILVEKYSSTPRHYFHAGIDGILTGPFDVLVDPMRSENFMLGQPRMVNHVPYYDVWTSYATTGFAPPPAAFDALHYQINTTIRPDDSIEADTTVDFRALAGGQSILFVQLARALKVDSVSLPSGESLFFFQNEGLTEQEVRSRGDDTLCIFLPAPPTPFPSAFVIAAMSSKTTATPSSSSARAPVGSPTSATPPPSPPMTSASAGPNTSALSPLAINPVSVRTAFSASLTGNPTARFPKPVLI